MSATQNFASEIRASHQRISQYVRKTDLMHSPWYSELTGANVFFKCENLQRTGSFKIRGATNKLLTLGNEVRKNGVVTASTGNHGKAVATICRELNCSNTIFAPNNADASKLDSIRLAGATVKIAGNDCVEAEAAARKFSESHDQTYISPYNDHAVVAGQGTIGFEISEQLDRVDAVIASLGGGGLLGGIGEFLRQQFPACEVIGCSPENSNVMIQSLQAGKLLDLPSLDTLSDGTAGGVEEDSITFGICQRQITQTISVTEREISSCLRQFIDRHSMLIEGAAAVPIAAMLREKQRLSGKNVVVILCGANISANRLSVALDEQTQ